MALNSLLCWQHGTIYQMYSRSFKDGKGCGIGDLPSITSKLNYLYVPGVDMLWLFSIYPSPMAYVQAIVHYMEIIQHERQRTG